MMSLDLEQLKASSTSIILFADQSALLVSSTQERNEQKTIGRFGRQTKLPEVERGLKSNILWFLLFLCKVQAACPE